VNEGRPGGVLALTAALEALPLPPPADGVASRPPPQPPSSPPVLAAPAAVAATLRAATCSSEAAKAAFDAPLPADGGGRSRLDLARGTPAAAAVAAAAAGDAVADARPAALVTTAMMWSLLTADNVSTAVAPLCSLSEVEPQWLFWVVVEDGSGVTTAATGAATTATEKGRRQRD